MNIPQQNCFAWAKILPPLAVIFFIGAMAISRRFDGAFADAMGTIAYVWLGWAFLWFMSTMVVMLIQLGLNIFKISIPFNLGLPVLGLATLIAAISVINGFATPGVKYINLVSPDLKTDKVTFVQIADSHMGQSVTPARVQKLVNRVNELNPDFIVFVGDIFENTGTRTQEYIDIINQLNPPYGKIGVLGNHEYYNGANINLAIWDKANIRPLLNEATDIEPMRIIGVNDIRVTKITKESFTEIIKKNDYPGYKLLLSHTPLYFEEAAENNINLMLSGHTHNGQIWPFKYLTMMQFKHVYGMYTAGKSNLYVTSGTFYWGPPMRFLTRNEIPFFTITKNEN